jgi:hypothetical protein
MSWYVFIGIPAYPGTVLLGSFYFCMNNLTWFMNLHLMTLLTLVRSAENLIYTCSLAMI